MRVLIIDDDDDIRLIAGMSLGRVGGMDVIEASGGAEGVQKAREQRPDVILLDMMMPAMDGSETLKALRSQPATALTPVIFLTCTTVGAEVERMMSLGAAGVLIKPFDPRTLSGAVRAFMRIVVHVRADLEELMPEYLASRHADIRAMREAVEQGDYDAIRIAGHSMRGSGGSYGFDTITEIGRALEQAADGRNPAEIHKWVDALVTYLDRVQVVYD